MSVRKMNLEPENILLSIEDCETNHADMLVPESFVEIAMEDL